MYCSNCGIEISDDDFYCRNCGAKLKNSDELDSLNNDIETVDNFELRHIEHEGLSFDCPDYYMIGKLPNNMPNRCVLGLVNKNKTCEFYFQVYRNKDFDDNARENKSLLIQYLKLYNYSNIREDNNFPNCFDATIGFELGRINSKILFDFNYENVIMIVGNVLSKNNYDCTNDLKIISESLNYKKINFLNSLKFRTKLSIFSFLITAVIFLVTPHRITFLSTWPICLPSLFLLVKSENSQVYGVFLLFIIFLALIYNFHKFAWSTAYFTNLWNPCLDEMWMVNYLVILFLINLICAIVLLFPLKSKKYY